METANRLLRTVPPLGRRRGSSSDSLGSSAPAPSALPPPLMTSPSPRPSAGGSTGGSLTSTIRNAGALDDSDDSMDGDDDDVVLLDSAVPSDRSVQAGPPPVAPLPLGAAGVSTAAASAGGAPPPPRPSSSSVAAAAQRRRKGRRSRGAGTAAVTDTSLPGSAASNSATQPAASVARPGKLRIPALLVVAFRSSLIFRSDPSFCFQLRPSLVGSFWSTPARAAARVTPTSISSPFIGTRARRPASGSRSLARGSPPSLRGLVGSAAVSSRPTRPSRPRTWLRAG